MVIVATENELTGIDYEAFYIGGRWVRADRTEPFTVINPSTEATVGTLPTGDVRHVDLAVAAARRQFDSGSGWSTWTETARAEVLCRFAEAVADRAEETARRISSQNGMPITMAQGLKPFSSLLLRYYAHMVSSLPTEERRPGLLGGTSVVLREPIGVVAAIVPWNAPHVQGMIKIAPALAAGCCVILKPPLEVALDSYLLADAAIAAGLPEGVLNIVPGGRDVGAYLVGHPGVDRVSFTGSTVAGRAIGEICGRLIRPTTLELGGKSAAVILDDADIAANLEPFFDATMALSGQICHLGTRVLVPQSRYRELVDTISELARSSVIGNANDPSTRVGPLVSAVQRQRVESYIDQGRSLGGRITAGGGRPTGHAHGWFVEPTVFVDLPPAAPLLREEIFGPVLTVIPYSDEDEAVRIANDSSYGLGGSIWTADEQRGEAIARRIRTGTLGVNFYANDPVAPFGGIKDSGLGRELGPEGLAADQILKTIYLPPHPAASHLALAAPGSSDNPNRREQ